jgi:putative zinc finger/helix-turn-helix YgiT family protein
MKCLECGNTMAKTVGDHIYRESGMEHVILRNITKLHCESCGAKRVQIPAIAQLHRALANALARKPARLIPSEVRFLRDHLELTNIEFAALMGVSQHQTSRWTSTEPIGVPAERFLRLLATFGPDLVKPRISDEPVEEQLKILAKTAGVAPAEFAQEAIEGIAQVIHHLPPPSAEARPVKIGLRHVSSGSWKQDPLAAN